MVGIHSPETEAEQDPEAVRRAVARFDLPYPHLLDNDMAYWKALGNEYWPAIYLVDRCRRIRYTHVGEVHADEDSGLRLEGHIEALLAESGRDCPPER